MLTLVANVIADLQRTRIDLYLIPQLLRRVFRQPVTLTARARLSSTEQPALIYAVGDVHGCMAELAALELEIGRDAAQSMGEKWLVMLGDYVDRGPRSADVLDHLIGPPPTGFKRFCLAGNHETMMLQFVDNPAPESDWLRFGGDATLASYGIDLIAFRRAPSAARGAILRSHIPSEHIDFLTELPVLLSVPGLNFVHAGLRPGVPLDEQTEEDLLWIREPFLSQYDGIEGLTIHGHTPVPNPVVTEHRIDIDTAAFASGILTAARIELGGSIAFLATRGPGGRQ